MFPRFACTVPSQGGRLPWSKYNPAAALFLLHSVEIRILSWAVSGPGFHSCPHLLAYYWGAEPEE